MRNLIEPSSVPAVGSHDDIYNRIVDEQLPHWFGSDTPVLNTVLEAYINTLIFNYQQYEYVILQQRLQTATDINLDQISTDYLGSLLPRRSGEDDDSYRNRISATLLQEKATRPGMDNALFILTGYHPLIFEPWNPFDSACCNIPQTNGCNVYGVCGSGSYAYQCFIDVYVDPYQGMASFGGCNAYNMPCNTIDPGAMNWCGGQSLQRTIISDQDIYTTINLTKVEGTICWVRILRQAPPTN